DKEHQGMTELALELNQLIEHNGLIGLEIDQIEEQKELLNQLYRAAEKHFAHEEKLIRDFHLDGMERQQEAHDRFLSMLWTFIHDFQAGKITISMELKLTILDWWIEHINQYDYHTFGVKNWKGAVLDRSLEWNDMHELVKHIGIEALDHEHEMMARYTFDFQKLLLDAKDPSTLDRAELLASFDKIYRCSDEHFSHEEQIIREFGLTGYDNQKKQHQVFMDMLRDYRERIEQGDIDFGNELKIKVLDWWLHHINLVDYQTFCENNWVLQKMEDARSWDDISGVIHSMNHEALDADHRQMAEITLDLSHLVELYENQVTPDAETVERTRRIFDDLYQLAADHFRREEMVLLERNLPNFELHKQLHENYLRKLNDFRQNFAAGRISLSHRLKAMVLDWWVNHINGIDYETFVKSSQPRTIPS
ncbi:MAG: hemerythrin family protein, partial [SAR324 cluster bacterium]|nr:hemerythrin family protein [SAR324 cluster bacterium]